ncbi:MAG: SDR family NAD(P)-dependent oxidoreductase, partial [Dehalococcoidia bacterium]|nr:SDR family NAD(P)-dependent oxidoreductase [Dehalococcoidia bacterium]
MHPCGTRHLWPSSPPERSFRAFESPAVYAACRPRNRPATAYVVEPSGGKRPGRADMDINGLSAIVTGGGSGLGEATARELNAQGAKVAILDLGSSNGAEVAASLGGLFTEADVTSDEQVTQAVADAAAAHGGVHILINCAGIATAERTVGREGPADLALFTRTVNINLIGTFNAIRVAATEMVKNDPTEDGERGVIINTAS